MDTLGFYYHDHDLLGCRHPEFTFVNFFKESAIPIPSEFREYKGRKLPVYELKTILGTVLDKNSYKHTVTLLTPDGVVNVKCMGEQYSKYDKQLSQPNPETVKKEVIEKSLFKRGTNLIVTGYRNGDQWMARSKAGENKFTFYKILDVDDTGALNITRYRADD